MTYQETLDYMFNSLPMYHRIGKAAYKADITNTVELMTHLGNPERGFRSIHIAGTNGKGSVSHFLASILHRSGLKVGLYTSPHLIDFRERIRIDGVMIPPERVVDFIERNCSFFEAHDLSFFEMTVGMAFEYFAAEKVDIAVVEVGMGGRLDSTNVITPLLSIITNISFDHTQFLGDTLAKIAVEKAGIIKPQVPVIIGQTQPETESVFRVKAAEEGAPIIFADHHYKVYEELNSPLQPSSSFGVLNFSVEKNGTPFFSHLCSPMAGNYQLKNLVTLMQALEILQMQGFAIGETAIRQGIERVIADTGLHGRWEQIGSKPAVVCETAHNEDGIYEMLAKLRELKYSRLHIVYGCVNDKDYRYILRLLPPEADYHFTQPSVPRGLEVSILADAAREEGIVGTAHATVAEAIADARAKSLPDDLILVTGSIFLVADVFAGIAAGSIANTK